MKFKVGDIVQHKDSTILRKEQKVVKIANKGERVEGPWAYGNDWPWTMCRDNYILEDKQGRRITYPVNSYDTFRLVKEKEMCKGCKFVEENKTVAVRIPVPLSDPARTREDFWCNKIEAYVHLEMDQCEEFIRSVKPQKCPRCKGEVRISTFSGFTYVKCDDTDNCDLIGPNADTEEEAIIEWNKLRYEDDCEPINKDKEFIQRDLDTLYKLSMDATTLESRVYFNRRIESLQNQYSELFGCNYCSIRSEGE